MYILCILYIYLYNWHVILGFMYNLYMPFTARTGHTHNFHEQSPGSNAAEILLTTILILHSHKPFCVDCHKTWAYKFNLKEIVFSQIKSKLIGSSLRTIAELHRKYKSSTKHHNHHLPCPLPRLQGKAILFSELNSSAFSLNILIINKIKALKKTTLITSKRHR